MDLPGGSTIRLKDIIQQCNEDQPASLLELQLAAANSLPTPLPLPLPMAMAHDAKFKAWQHFLGLTETTLLQMREVCKESLLGRRRSSTCSGDVLAALLYRSQSTGVDSVGRRSTEYSHHSMPQALAPARGRGKHVPLRKRAMEPSYEERVVTRAAKMEKGKGGGNNADGD